MSLGLANQQQIFWIDDTLWNLYGDLRERLFDRHGLRLEQWRRDGRATLVKAGAGRSIYRVRLPGLDLFVKHFRAGNLTSLLHQTIRRGRAEREFQLAHLLKEHGIETISPIALGERRRNGVLIESYLLTEAIPGGLTLYEVVERYVLTGRMPFAARLRFHFADELGKLAAKIHEAGIEHRDLHEKNIVVQQKPDGRYRFYLLDLHESRIVRPLGWARAARELARMGRYFTLRTSRSDRLRFFVSYGKARGFSRDRIAALAPAVEAATLESRADFWRRRDGRGLHKNPRFRRYHSPGRLALADRELPEQTVRLLMQDPDGPFQSSVVHWWKIGRATRVAEIELLAIRRGDTLIYKQYYFKGWHESAAALLRYNQATRAWQNGGALLMRELPTPRPLMLIHKLRFGLPVTSYLVTECVPGAQTITRYLDRRLPGLPANEQRRIVRGVLAQAARLLRTMHDRRVTHRDLKSSNVLVSQTDDLAAPQLWLIDLDGVQTWLRVPWRHRLQNLSRFYVSFHSSPWITLTDRLRFLRTYLAGSFRQRRSWKDLWNSIAREAEKKIRRNLRKGRSVV